MAKKSSKSTSKKTAAEASTKGKLVEFIVASMHKVSGVKVETNIKLPALHSKFNRKRQIDVLLTATAAGYPFRFAIECKNYKKVIGAPLIGAFISALEDIGLAPQQGIYVSANRFTNDAKELAEKNGMRLLRLTGLTQDRMAAYFEKAIQASVYLMLNVIEYDLKPESEHVREVPNTPDGCAIIFYDEEGGRCGDLRDEIWVKWLLGNFNRVLRYDLNVETPSHWHVARQGKLYRIKSFSVSVHVVAFVLKLSGKFSQHTLVNAANDEIEKLQTNVSIPLKSGNYSIEEFRDEHDLYEFLDRQPEIVKLTTWMKVPRIWFDSTYWPLSERAEREVAERMEAYQSGLITDPRPQDESKIEGTDLKTAWEPISLHHWGHQLFIDEDLKEENVSNISGIVTSKISEIHSISDLRRAIQKQGFTPNATPESTLWHNNEPL